MPPPLGRNLGTVVIIRSNALCWGESEKIIVLLLCLRNKKRANRFFSKTIGSEGNKNRQVVSLTICRPCSVFSCYLGSYLSSKGKSRFFIYDFETSKNGSWVAKKPDKIGLSAGYIFFVPS
jgi:hypothetical protein